jgi:hypothetical protein
MTSPFALGGCIRSFQRMRRPIIHAPLVCALIVAGMAAGCDAAGPPADHGCTDARVIAALPASIDEASGIAAAGSLPGVLWVHNDSEGSPLLYAIDRSGSLLAEIALPAAGTQQDWEDIAVGPCPDGHCIYIGDIGDNYHNREDRAILRLAEPGPDRTDVGRIERFPFQYPGGPRDAEALFVMPDTTVWIITKGREAAVGLYRYPPPLRSDERVTLQLVQHLSAGIVQVPAMVTGADAAADGSRIAVRTYSSLRMYAFDGDTLAALWPAPGLALGALAEPQGEGVAIAGDTIFLVSETGPFSDVAPFSMLVCPAA